VVGVVGVLIGVEFVESEDGREISKISTINDTLFELCHPPNTILFPDDVASSSQRG
jgi:hypothetical protein